MLKRLFYDKKKNAKILALLKFDNFSKMHNSFSGNEYKTLIKTKTGVVYSNCSNHCPRFVETKTLSSIYRDQITVLDLSRPNDCPRFIETKSLPSIY